MKLLLYCTKAKPYLYHFLDYCHDTMTTSDLGYILLNLGSYREYDENGKFLGWNTYDKEAVEKGEVDGLLNGKIVGECDYEVEKIESRYIDHEYSELKEICNKSCLSTYALMDYARKDKFCFELSFYAIHIKNLTIYDKPRELSELSEKTDQHLINKAPQNMMYCWDNGEPKVLISIRPEWLCKILNGEKTIEVRRKVLKEMINND